MPSDLACNLQAISPARPPRYGEVVSRLRSAMYDCNELRDGYRYALRTSEITLPEVAEWITMEHVCCPFLDFQLEIADDDVALTLRGPDGVKAILRAEFPASRG